MIDPKITLNKPEIQREEPKRENGKVLCANPHELPINGTYEGCDGKTYYHGKYANPEEVGEYHEPQCKWCRNITNHQDYGCEDDYSEEDQGAEDEAIAYDRFNQVSEIVM